MERFRCSGAKDPFLSITFSIGHAIVVFDAGLKFMNGNFNRKGGIGDVGGCLTNKGLKFGIGGVFKDDITEDVAPCPENGGFLRRIAAGNAVDERHLYTPIRDGSIGIVV